MSGRGHDVRSEAELLAAMGGQPAAALGVLYDRYWRVLHGLAETMLARDGSGPLPDAELR